VFSGHSAEDWRNGIGPWEQFIDFVVRVTVDDLGDDVGAIELVIDGVELTDLASDAMIAQCSPPASRPAP
jgi:hypothetical protein